MNTVEPIRDTKKLTEIMTDLEADTTWHGKRAYLLFMTLYSTGLRVGDVVRLRKKHVMNGVIELREEKTGKSQIIPLQRVLIDVYDNRLKDISPEDYIFPSRKRRPDGTQRPITTRSAGYDMQMIKKRFNINTPFSCHSMRKTHGYMRYKSGDTIEALRQHFNHADEATTRRYIGIDNEERNKGLLSLPYPNFKPEMPETRTKRKKNSAAPLEVARQDRTEQGKAYGKRKKAAVRNTELKKKIKSEYDRKRYQQRKAQKAREKTEYQG